MQQSYKELVAQQIELEKEITQKSIDNYIRLFNEAKDTDNLTVTKPLQRLLSKTIEPFEKEIINYLKKYEDGEVMRKPVAAAKLLEIKKTLSVKEIAFISVKMVFNTLYKQVNRQKIAEKISNALESELKLRLLKEVNTSYYDTVLTELRSRNARVDWKCKALTISFNKKFMTEIKPWSYQQTYQIGFILLELLKQSTGFIEFKTIYEKGKSKIFVTATDETLEWIEKTNKVFEVLQPFFLPMICEPKEWTGIYSGGYISPYLIRNKFIKNPNKDYLKYLDKVNMPEVYSAVNTIQSTPWKINKKVLDTALLLWEQGKSTGGLPNRENQEPPPFPYPNLDKGSRTEEQKRIIRMWKNEAVAAYKQNIQSRSIRLLTAQILQLAQRFSNYENIWFPYQLDFRGRIYPIPALLQPQGNDLAKGLLLFGKGEKIGDETAVNWLRVHGANTFGIDKVSYEERIQWIKDNEEKIKEYSENPIKNQGWAEADKPFQFLAFCFEYAGYLENGYDFVTCLPVYVDGTCNGLQHYSALLRDSTAGKAVNLIDSDKPADIYEEVAEKLREKLDAFLIQNSPEVSSEVRDFSRRNNTSNISVSNIYGLGTFASSWRNLGINRNLTKRPVMVLPYGGTKLSCRAYIEEYLLDNYSLQYLYEHFGGVGKDAHSTVFQASKWLSDYLWEAITETLQSAIVGMEYIRHKLKGHKDKPLEWLTPCGLLVHQAYKNMTRTSIQTELYGSIHRYSVKIPSKNDDLSNQKQTNGICPNFIHSIDAACLMKFLNKAKEAGINSFGAVHDSYGTLACHTEDTQRFLRESFVDIYDYKEGEKDILEEFIEDITGEKVDDLPTKGDLDINEVLKSKYFFN